MTYQLLTKVIQSIISATEKTAVTAVTALKAHTFSARVSNFPKTQTVKGTVTVGNQKNVEIRLKDISTTLKTLKKAVVSFKAPDEIRVSNFPEYPRFPEINIPEQIEVKNFPKTKFPEEFRVSNQPIRELKKLESELEKVSKAIKALKLDPKIEVKAPKPEKLVVPPANVSVTQTEIDYQKLSKLLAAQVPELDYEKLAHTLSKELGQMVITSGSGGGKYAFKDASGNGAYGRVDSNGAVAVQAAPELYIRNIDNSDPALQYVGKAADDGTWRIMKIVNDNTFSYATGTTDYSTNWTNRASLTYS